MRWLVPQRAWKEHVQLVVRAYTMLKAATALVMLFAGFVFLHKFVKIRCLMPREMVFGAAILVGLMLGHRLGALFHRGTIAMLISQREGFNALAAVRHTLMEHMLLPGLFLVLAVLVPLGGIAISDRLPRSSPWQWWVVSAVQISILALPIALIGTGLSVAYHGDWPPLVLKRIREVRT